MIRQSLSPTAPPPLDAPHNYDSTHRRPSFPRLGSTTDTRVQRNPLMRSLTQPKLSQYAHPISRHDSYRSQGSASDAGGDGPVPEHMLRRKTPKGTLPAAYDGTSVVNEIEKPHASKHILLPGPSGESSTAHRLQQELPLRTPRAALNGYQENRAPQELDQNQAPRQEPYPQWHPVPQKMHDYGLVGITRPEGTMAHSRDARFNSNHANFAEPSPNAHFAPTPLPPHFSHPQQAQSLDWSPSRYFRAGSGRLPHTQQAPGLGMPQIDSMLYPMPSINPQYLQQPAQYPPYGGPYGVPYGLVMEPTQHSFGPTVSDDQGPYGPFWQDGTYIPYQPVAQRDLRYYPYHNQRPPLPQLQNNYHRQGPGANVNLRGGAYPHPLSEPLPGTLSVDEFGPPFTQTRDEVFARAHTVYNDFLKYLNSTRRSQRHANGPHGVRQPIYPTPPKAPKRHASDRPSLSARSSYSSTNNELQGASPNSLGQPYLGDGYNLQHAPLLQMRPPNQSSNFHTPWEPVRPLRRMSGTSIGGANQNQNFRNDNPPSTRAASALAAMTEHCRQNADWIDGMLLAGCLAHALGDYNQAQRWFQQILSRDRDHVEAISNLAATLNALHQIPEAERQWRRAVQLRPSHLEAVLHLVILLCSDGRTAELVKIIEDVEQALKLDKNSSSTPRTKPLGSVSSASTVSESPNISEASDRPFFEFHGDSVAFNRENRVPGSDQHGFGSSGYAIPGSENGRILNLVHIKGNMLYGLGDNQGAAKAFGDAVLIAAGQKVDGIDGLINLILSVISNEEGPPSSNPILLHPTPALQTARLCFPPKGELPGLRYVTDEDGRKHAKQITSNSLLSLAKIFQDGMASGSPKGSMLLSSHGVREILALYYLSLSLQPSPSTANNVGILLASVQQSAPSRRFDANYPNDALPRIPGLVPGSGIALAVAYYNYGLGIDSRHAHLYTNLGSLLKDIGQLDAAIQMYEQAVSCDGNFDIALANLANAVKDKGRISDAIGYYKRAVKASPGFAEAVCGLANALNSVCDWKERGGIADNNAARDPWHVDDTGMLLDARGNPNAKSFGWIKRVVDLVEKQLLEGEDWGKGIMDDNFINFMAQCLVRNDSNDSPEHRQERIRSTTDTLKQLRGKKWEGAQIVRLVERAIKRLSWGWYQDRKANKERPAHYYQRPQLPPALTIPTAPTVLPFHTFTCPMSASQIRMISQRNGLRISCSTLKSPWLPVNVYPPPSPPRPQLNVGYVSSDFNNHPLAHLMQSVFGLHNRARVKAFCYATTPSDGSQYRLQIEKESPVFYDASSWSAEGLVNQIVKDEIHILVNLNGYTRGARNEVFAARPAPIQMSFMGFAGTLGAEWCDYLLADDTAVPPDTLRSWRRNVDMEDLLTDENNGGKDKDWIYGENIIFCRDTFFCCDHRQSAPDAKDRRLNWEEEQENRWAMRRKLFPGLPDTAIILGNFNQLYKIEPTIFRTWLRILARLPNAVLWLLRFPDLGETNLKQTALKWAGSEVASRVIFTHVAQKHEHIARARVCDLFLDTPECNAHTTSADVLWSGTPLLTLPRYKYKMCSRMAASILKGALPNNEEGKRAAKELIAGSEDEYEAMAVKLGQDTVYSNGKATGRLSELRRLLFEARWSSALFDTKRWVTDLEEAYWIAWRKWESGEGGDIWLEGQRGF